MVLRRGALVAVLATCLVGVVATPNAIAADFLQPITSPEPSRAGPAGVATGDVDNDGDQDIVEANGFSATTSVLLNNGVGDFREILVASNLATTDVALGKFDNDSNLDLVFLYPGSPPGAGLLAIFKGNGNGTFTFLGGNALVATGVRPTQIAVGNFNADAINDVAVVNSQNTPTTTAGTVMTFLGNPLGNDTFAAATPAQTLTAQLGAADIVFDNFNGGPNDLVVSNTTSQSTSFLAGNGVGFAAAVNAAAGAGLLYMASGNLNGDANADIVATIMNSNPSAVRTLFGNNAGAFPTQATVVASPAGHAIPQQVVARDFDNDADLDLAVANGTPNSVSILNNGGAGMFTQAPTSPEILTGVTPAGALPFGLASADFDGSGFNDLAATPLFSSPSVTPILLNQTGNQADLSIVKTDAPDPVAAGNQLTYSLAVTNNGANAVTSAKATDQLPAGTSFNAAASSPSCTAIGAAPQLVTCDYGGVAGGATESQNVVVDVGTVAPPASLSNTATVAGNLADPIPANNTSTTTTAVTPRADVSIVKSDAGSDPVNVGQDITYTLTATNGGPNTALNVTATDPLPPGTSFNAGASNPACSELGGTVTCTFGDIASGAGVARNVVLTTGAAAAPSVTNTATVDTDSFDPNAANDADSETTTVNPVADLSIDKTDSPDPIHVGEDVTYTIDVTNGGPNAATNVIVTDTLPAEVTYDDGASDPRCNQTIPGTVSCDLDTIASGANDSVDIVATGNAPAAAAGDSATVDADELDPNGANNTDVETTEILAAADLAIDKSDAGSDPVNAGDDITYSLAVTNNGPNDATGVHATDTLPPGLTFESSPDNCTAAGQDVDCDFGAVANGATETQTFVVGTDASAAPEVDNTATVDGIEDDLVPANNSDTETTTVNAAAGLSIAKSDDADPVHVGDDITYTLDVTNAGPSAATNVVVTDTLPAEVSYDDTASDGRCNETSPGTVECTAVLIANGSNDSWDLVVSADAPTPAAIDSATVASDEVDPIPADNFDTESTEIRAVADLAIDKFDAVDPVHVGDDVIYTLDVANGGPNTATNVTVTDTLPAEVTYDEAASDIRCDEISPGVVECDLGTIAASAGDAALIVAEADAPAAPATNSATVVADEDDLNPLNNSATEDTLILADADLAISKSDDADPVHVGDDITYTLDVTNNGPSDANNVAVSDDLPTEVSYDDGASDPRCVETSPGTVSCDLDTIASGAGDSVEIVATADAPAAAASDSASVSADEDDLTPGNNSDTETTEIRAFADLSIDKEDASDPVNIGDDITYTLAVTNDGPSGATDVHATDTLPAGLTFESSPDGCTVAGGIVDCDFGAVASGATETQAFVVSTSGPASPSVDNTADVAGAEDDPDLGNNSDTETTTVNPSADLSISKDDSGSDPVNVGDDIVYTLSVTNSGPSGATGVQATDNLPAGLTFNPAGSDGACSEAGGIVTCDYGAVASGDTEDLALAATTDVAATPSVDNTATVGGLEDDPDNADNSDTETTTVNGTADLAISKTATNAPVNAGEFVVYELEVTNNGPTNAGDVTATDILPAGTTFRASGSSTECSEAAGTVSCDYGDVDNATSETRTVILKTSATSVPSFDNTATVNSPTNDPVNGNNSDTETVQVHPAADLALTKLDAVDPVTVGDEITYALTVENLGPSNATNVIVTDPLPPEVTFRAEGPGSDCSPNAVPPIVVHCDFGGVPNGSTENQTFVVTTSTTGTVSNTAVVDGDESDPDLANNTESETTLVNPLVIAPPVDTTTTPPPTPTPPATTPGMTTSAKKKCKRKKSKKARKRCLRKLKKKSA